MVTRPRVRRAPWIALAAIVGVLAAADVADACSTPSRAEHSLRGCCPERGAAAMACCRAPDAAPARRDLPADRPTVAEAAGPHAEGVGSCVCPDGDRNDPAAPTRDRRVLEGRPDRAQVAEPLVTVAVPRAAIASAADALVVRPPGAPLYLRLLHLLF